MEKLLRLAPPISSVIVKRVNTDDTLEIQVIPSTKTAKNEKLHLDSLKPYEVRRKYQDLKAFQKCVIAANISISFPSTKGKSSSNLQLRFQEYLDKIFTLPEDIFEELPIREFFGEWSHELVEPDLVLLPQPLTNEIGATASLGSDTKGNALTNILKLDDEMRAAKDRTLSRISSMKPKQIPLDNFEKSKTEQINHNYYHGSKSNRETIIPTYEEFVSKLAASLSIDIIENKEIPQSYSRDTIRYSLRDMAISIAESKDSMSTESTDTILSENGPNSIKQQPLHSALIDSSEKRQSQPVLFDHNINSKKSVGSLSSIYDHSSTYNIVIPSRKDSRNWTTESPLSSVKSDGKIQPYNIPPKNDSSAHPQFFDPQPPVLAIRSGEEKFSKTQKRNVFTLKIIPISGSHTTIKVSDTLEYSDLLGKLCLIIGVRSMDLFRISYRDLDTLELIIIADDESWNICKESMVSDQLSIFISPK